MRSSCFAIASHLDNFDLKCVILSKEVLYCECFLRGTTWVVFLLLGSCSFF